MKREPTWIELVLSCLVTLLTGLSLWALMVQANRYETLERCSKRHHDYLWERIEIAEDLNKKYQEAYGGLPLPRGCMVIGGIKPGETRTVHMGAEK